MHQKKLILSLSLVVAVAIGCAVHNHHGGVAGDPNYKSKVLSVVTPMTHGSTYSVTVCTTNSSALNDAPALSSKTWVYICTSSVSLATASNLTEFTVASLPKKAYTNCTGNITIPSTWPTGQSYIFSYADKRNDILESNENDNTNAVAVTIQ
ncbi:MAG: CARDB domain-containing protein [Verrucomicrobiota bacterium]